MSQWDEILSIGFGALCAMRENRGGGRAGLQSVLNVLANRAKRDGKSIYEECVMPDQFSSMTVPGDPEIATYWREGMREWPEFSLALYLAQSAQDGSLNDLTSGSTLYYAPAGIKSSKTITLPDGRVVPFPEGWNEAVVKFQTEIAGQLFFTEG